MAAYENDLSELVYELNSSTAVAKRERSSSLDALLSAAVEQRATDIILIAGVGGYISDQWVVDGRGRKTDVFGRPAQGASAFADERSVEGA